MMRLMKSAVSLFLAASLPALADQTSPQMRLLDDLDFPGEGYCIDVPGVGQTARTDLPLVMHNCLPERRSVDRIAEERDGRIYMPAYDACVTALGVWSVLPGVPVMLRPCGTNESFLQADQFQKFERTANNQLRLTDSSLCLTAGPDADRTYSPTHRWRTLTMEDCAEVPLFLSAWR
ncbi:ricin-type beta-trefoil lectin domain protein [Denitrobaculum tricleocarpae]|uniref:Ricin-type beta-trefoil lectin domain protein n=1 Tax=Denitrobaculum tricleocarpae TaxID=2591009 RepID=A0A545TX85_9PROT|nr:ricin-type beta-trefoil lectin domain protein [Denitrobaculum tricleocarpae]TQV81832.1 ricin-type beta-trefoil lectin domain protein [Denitrobaculum tricleocarpae]